MSDKPELTYTQRMMEAYENSERHARERTLQEVANLKQQLLEMQKQLEAQAASDASGNSLRETWTQILAKRQQEEDEPLAIKREQFKKERDAARAANAISPQMLFNKLRLMKVKLSTIEIATATLRDQIDSILEQISE